MKAFSADALRMAKKAWGIEIAVPPPLAVKEAFARREVRSIGTLGTAPLKSFD